MEYINTTEFSFSELVDCKQLQIQMDLFYDLVGLGIGVIDNNNKVLVSNGWQEICTHFHRKHPETCKRCVKSDTHLLNIKNSGKPIKHRCENGMWDTAIPIIIEDKVLAGIYFGQFFYDDQVIDTSFFEKQADEFGFNKQTYINALKKVPVLSRQKVKKLITYYTNMAQSLANIGHQNILIKRTQIQERYIFQQKLIENERKLNSLFESIDVGILITDERGKIIDCNQKAETLLKISKETLVLQRYSEKELQIIGPNLHPLPKEEYPSIMALRENKTITNKIMGIVDSTTSWFSVNASPINLDGYGALISFIDISELKIKEQKLEESEAQFKNLFKKHASVMLLIEPLNGQILNANASAAEFYGYSIPQLCQKNISEINVLNPEQIANERKKAFEEKRNYFIFPHKLASGDERIVEVHSSPILYNQNKILFSIIHDITERNIAEQTLRVKEEELLKLNADKNRFISILGHDLRGPIGSVCGLLDLITPTLKEYDINELESYINMINTSVHHTSNLIDDILLWARANMDSISFNSEYINVSEVCNRVIDNLKMIAQDKNISISYSTPTDIILNADKNMLNTIVRNLVSNALKFTHRGGTITIMAETHKKNILITISDNGIGIEPKNLPKLFDLSQKMTTTGTENEKGTGLGLLLCKEFVEKHGGTIWAESELGKGSQFKFSIPIT